MRNEIIKNISNFRSLDEYFDYCGIEEDYRPAYRQWIIAWLKLSDEEKLDLKRRTAGE